MSGSLRRTGQMALLVPVLAACAGAPLVPAPGAERYEAELTRAASTITPEAVLTNISVIAHDSMGGRDTPSPGLEKTAEYFASRYREWGIEPAGENGTYFQRYPLARRGIDQDAAQVQLNENGIISTYRMGRFGYASGGGLAGATTAPMVILGGALTPEAIAGANLKGKIVVGVYDAAKAVDWRNWNRMILAEQPVGVVYIQNGPMDQFTRAAQFAANPRPTLLLGDGTGIPVFTLHDSMFVGDPQQLNRPDWNQMRAVPQPVVQVTPPEFAMTLVAPVKVAGQFDVPNVVGMIRGSDPLLRDEYVVYSAHMDHVGTNPNSRTPGDTIWNGADDDASGSTGVLLIAEAFSRLKVKPRRSVIFLHVSGEEKGLLGSRWFSEHPTVPLAQTVADINMDMIGRNNPDSIVVIGKEHSDMGTTLARVNARHPELGLTTADDIWPNERFYFRSDHFNFARKGVPILFFFNGVHADYHRETDEVEKIDTSKLSRVAKVGFYLGAEIANTTQRPEWNPESYKEIVGSER